MLMDNNGLGGRNVEYLALLGSLWEAHLTLRAGPTVVSTFAGAGGSSLGYSAAGFQELLATDGDEGCAKTFRINFPGVPYLVADVRELTAEALMEAAGVSLGELDVLDGSPPCQGFSTAGKRELADPRNQLYNEFVRLLQGVRPRAFVLENVSGMVKGKMKVLFVDKTRKLKAAGYRVSCRLLDAKWLGVPQSRKRLIWVGIREDIGVDPRHPEPFGRPFSLADAIWDLLPGVAGQVSPFERADFVRACKNDLHSNEWRSSREEGPTVTSCRPPVVKVEARGGGYMAGCEWDGAAPLGAALPTLPPKIRFAANSGRDGRPIPVSEASPPLTTAAPRVAGSREGANPRYEVLAPKLPHHRGERWAESGRAASEPSWALPASVAPWLRTKRGLAYDNADRDIDKESYSVRAAGPPLLDGESESRPLTVRECARVQSFPDQFELPDGAKGYRQVGNSVPPLMMKAIALTVMELLAEAD